MDFKEIGRVHLYLLEKRIVETRPGGRKASGLEQEIADILIQMNYDETDALNDLFSAHGMKMRFYNDVDMPGIPRNGRIWMLLRDTSLECPKYISSSAVVTSIALRDSEPVEKTSIWFLHIWLSFLAVLYTHTGRSVSEVSGYIDTFFKREHIINAVVEHIEQIRSIGVMGGINEKVFDALDSEKGKEVPKRVHAFLKTLEDSKLIVSTGDDEYQQTLLGAVEMENNYTRSFGIIIPEDTNLENIVSLATDGATLTSDEA